MPRKGVSRQNNTVTHGKESGVAIRRLKSFMIWFSRFDTIAACDRQTDGQTDILWQLSPHYA